MSFAGKKPQKKCTQHIKWKKKKTLRYKNAAKREIIVREKVREMDQKCNLFPFG